MARLDSRSEAGTLFYALGGIAELGRVGMAAIGNSGEEAEAIFARTMAALDEGATGVP